MIPMHWWLKLAECLTIRACADLPRNSPQCGCRFMISNLSMKRERHFPTFAGLRDAMHEETVLFFTDLFQNDRSVLSMIDADYAFLNGPLAEHYGIPNVSGPEWRRVEDIRKFGRGVS